MKRFVIFSGNYGSGKTELSLNTAMELSEKGMTVLVDMDIVNPYFRSAEHGAELKEKGVDLIAPTYANTTVDVPVIGPEVKSAFNYDYAVFDAGGDPVGSAVFGSVADQFDPDATDLYYVVNARRPLQRDASEIMTMMGQIQGRADLKMTGIINNTNLARETKTDDLVYGLEVCRELSGLTGLPIVFSSGTKEIISGFSKRFPDEEVKIISVYTRPDWLDTTSG